MAITASKQLAVNTLYRSSDDSPTSINENVTILLPIYTVLVSALLLCFHAVLHLLNPKPTSDAVEVLMPTLASDAFMHISPHIKRHEGGTVFAYNIARLVACFILVCLAAFSQQTSGEGILFHGVNFQSQVDYMLVSFLYASLLAILITSCRPQWRKILTRHFNLVSLTLFLIYTYRNLLPLAMYGRSPMDISEGWALWAKILVLALIAFAIPLLIPRQSLPIDPEGLDDPTFPVNPEQTASLISFFTFSFLDRILLLGIRHGRITSDQLPPLADCDRASYLKSSAFQYVKVDRNRHLFWSLLRFFRHKYLIQAISIILRVTSGFISPYAVKELLRYIETQGEGAIFRPWFWIFWLVAGPTISIISFQCYTYFSSMTRIHAECIITQLVFEHSLRIRVKHEGPHSSRSAGSTPASVPVSILPAENPSVLASSPGLTPGLGTDSESTPFSLYTAQPTSAVSTVVGKINNLVSTDLANAVDGCDFLLLFLYVPLEISLSMVFLYTVLGWSAFVGLAVIVITSPAPRYIMKHIRNVQVIKLLKTDSRIQMVAEMMGVIRMVKVFAWERDVKRNVAEKRQEELVLVRCRQLLDLINNNIKYLLDSIVDDGRNICYIRLSQFCFMCCVLASDFRAKTLVMKEELNASKVFSSMTVFEMLREQLRMAFQTAMNVLVTGRVSVDRVNDFLHNVCLFCFSLSVAYLHERGLKAELLESFTGNQSLSTRPNLYPKTEIGFNNAIFSWSNDAGPSARRFTLKIDEELLFKQGQINLIMGPTGSGKTSILMALLGEMYFFPSGSASWYNLPRNSGVAYAAQESWVQNGTIRENIMFGSAFDEARYKKVLYQCCLEPDLSLFEAGDQTEVGERGHTLSGGQKARITLARAVYSDAEILLLDDILAALDVRTAKLIVARCLTGDLVQGRTVLLVTHDVSLISLAGLVVSLNADGTLLSYTPDASTIAEGQRPRDENQSVSEHSVPPVEHLSDGKLTTAEVVEKGHVGWAALKLYLAALGGQHHFLFFFASAGGLVLSQLSDTAQTWYLGHWASQYETRPPSEVNALHYLGICGCLSSLAVATYCVASVAYIFGTIRASRKLHSDLIASVLSATLRWLDVTPTSRLIARCTQDIQARKSTLVGPLRIMLSSLFSGWTHPFKLIKTLQQNVIAIVVLSPSFLAPSLLVAFLGGLCGQVYMTVQLPVKRMMSNAKAPILGHFGAAMTGLVSIRAFGAQEAFSEKCLQSIDGYTRAARTFYNLNRWINVRVGLLGAVFSASLATYLVYFHELSAANTGFSLNMAGKDKLVTGRITHCCGGSETSMSSKCKCNSPYATANSLHIVQPSLERIQSFLEIEHEPKSTVNGVPPAYWPSSGDLRVESLCARYSPDGPNVLHSLSFHIESGERIGVVGRTGSGKSSLTLSLLRCMITEGDMFYDGVNTRDVNLDVLRSKISIIPQIPELLSGTLRRNLDPFDQFDDAVLNGALSAAGMSSLQSNATGHEGKITLDTFISGGGANLSIGQRQILALARAIVRGGKLLILDEDHATDNVIQSCLRNQLGKDMTVITVAHRLQTVMDADKIMVLDAGRIVEFDSPYKLLKRKDGRLRALVDASGDRDALYEMAAKRG
ncbi:ATP-binding cassette transporter abc4 [Hypsizygus marmoreus]|uniref:ATP-binding cassette transporter abc4 n=1 Tax=Hypsizygus marmoreus TaxID=39966 RepID=A0A369JW04_HYPMA|nr:ATP-binding cassette transporter abc4 [Hypsizygus marmoreus]